MVSSVVMRNSMIALSSTGLINTLHGNVTTIATGSSPYSGFLS